MRACDILEAFSHISALVNAAPNSTIVQIKNGKMRYLAVGALIELDIEFPDVFFPTSQLEFIMDWLIGFGENQVQVLVNNKAMVFSAQLDDVSYTISIAAFSHGVDYEDIDEVVLKPLLTNKYSFSLPAETLHKIQTAMLCPNFWVPPHEALISINIDDSAVRFSADNGSTKAMLQTDSSLPTGWKNTYMTATFSTQIYATSDVKISFKNNEAKVLSPLLMEYSNGVKVVLSPVWQ